MSLRQTDPGRTVPGDFAFGPPSGPDREMDTTSREYPESGEICPDAFLISTFQKWTKRKQFPTRGGEAEIFLVEHQGEKQILKLYFFGIMPKKEILERIRDISQEHFHYFPRVLQVGFDEPSRRFFEIQEYFPQGTLKDWMDRNEFPTEGIHDFLTQMTAGLDLLHSHQILHLDLKPSNILVASEHPPSFRITDFGISSILEEEFSKKVTQVKGTSLYQSPESLSGVFHSRSDWWSLGVIVVELLTGTHPFAGMPQTAIFFHLAGKGFPIPESIKEPWRSLVKGLLTRDPEHRWDKNRIERWLRGDFTSDEVTESNSAVPQNEFAHPLILCHRRCNRLEDFLAALIDSPQNWQEAEKMMETGVLVKWLKGNQASAQAAKISAFFRSGQHPSFGVFRTLVYFRPDLPLSWEGGRLDRSYWSGHLEQTLKARLSDRDTEFMRVLFSGELEQIIRETIGNVPSEIHDLFSLIQPFRDCPVGKAGFEGIPGFLELNRTGFFSGSILAQMAEYIKPRPGIEPVFRLMKDPGFSAWATTKGFAGKLAWNLVQCWQEVFPVFHPQSGEMLQALVAKEALLLADVNDNPDLLAQMARLFVSGIPAVDLRKWVLAHFEMIEWLRPLVCARVSAKNEGEGHDFFEKLHLLASMQENAKVMNEVLLPAFLGRPLTLLRHESSSAEFRLCLLHVSVDILRAVQQNPEILPRSGDNEFPNVPDLERVLAKLGNVNIPTASPDQFKILLRFARKYKSLENAYFRQKNLLGVFFLAPGDGGLSWKETREVCGGLIALFMLPFGLAAIPALLFFLYGFIGSLHLRWRRSHDLRKEMTALLAKYQELTVDSASTPCFSSEENP